MNSFEAVQQFIVPAHICDETDKLLSTAGHRQNEYFVLWSGKFDERNFHIETLHNPKQKALRLKNGLCVQVDGLELHQLNYWLYENGERLAVQVHSHPTRAFHSQLDDSHAMVTTLGGLSLVVPNFCIHGVRGPGVALYRLYHAGWLLVAPHQFRRTLRLGG